MTQELSRKDKFYEMLEIVDRENGWGGILEDGGHPPPYLSEFKAIEFAFSKLQDAFNHLLDEISDEEYILLAHKEN